MAALPPDNFIQAENPTVNTLPWSVRDTFIGVGMMVCLTIIALVLAAFWRGSIIFQTFGMLGLELMYVFPILGVIGLRKATWNSFGFNRFNKSAIGIGCGLMLGGYFIIAAHNLILIALKLQPQAMEFMQMFDQLKMPVGFVLAGVFVAPLSEELFFRGFLFGGLEQRYGWKKAALVSSLIFALFHLDPVSLVPTFILGSIFAYLYYQSKSIWPGIFLHFLTNSVGICSLLALSQMPHP